MAFALTLVLFLWPAKEEERLSLSATMEVPKEAKELSRTDVSGITSTVMQSPHFTGEDEKGRRWSIKAKEAIQQSTTSSETMILTEINGISTTQKGEEVTFKANEGALQNNVGDMSLKGDVKIQGLGYTFKTETLSGNLKSFNLKSDEKVYITSPIGFLEAGSFEMIKGDDKIIFQKGVHVRLHQGRVEK